MGSIFGSDIDNPGLAFSSRYNHPVPSEPLTAREAQVFQLLGKGMTNREIAAELAISISTAETHRRNIARKFGFSGSKLIHVASLCC